MDSDSEIEVSNWGKAKHDYYYNDYIDQDYPKITAKEERLAEIEQEQALRIQKKLYSNLDDVDLNLGFDEQADITNLEENIIDLIENRNKSMSQSKVVAIASNKRKRVQFQDQEASEDDSDGQEDDEEDDDDSDGNQDNDDNNYNNGTHKRRPINMAMRKNRGLTPYKKKEYRNPRVKHKLKYKKAMSKRRRNVKEAQIEYHRYSGESTGIKTSTVKSIKLC